MQAQGDLGLSAAGDFGRLMSGRLDLAQGDSDQPLSFYVVGTAGSHDVTRSLRTIAYDYDNSGVAAGAEYRAGPVMLGAAVSYSRPQVDFVSGTGRIRSDAWQVGGYGKVEFGGAGFEAFAGYGWLDHDIRRTAVIDEISGQADGKALVAGAEASYLFDAGKLKVGPVAGVQYARATMDGFTETGDPVLTLNVSRQRLSHLVGQAGVEADFGMDVGGLSVQPFVKLLAEKELDSSRSTISYANTSAPTIVNSLNLGGADDDAYGRVEGGISFALGSRISLQVQASATVEHPQRDEFSGFAGVKIGF
jgi:outer membrane autotransporter protein